MRFLAKFCKAGQTYFKTIWADDINEADRQARKWTRKGFMCVSVVQEL